jgi:small subunit ribosomal protein S11
MADEKVKEEKKPKTKAPAKAAAQAEAAAPAAAAAAAPSAPVPTDAATLLSQEGAPVKKQKIKGAKHVPFGIVFINASFNNTIISITDMKGNVIAWSTSGRSGFKGSRKSTAFAATMAAQDASRQAVNHGLQEVEIRVQGPGAGRESAIRAVQAAGISVTTIKDITPLPHNGCRSPKRRRV